MFVRFQSFPTASSLFEPLVNFEKGSDETIDDFLKDAQSRRVHLPIDIAEYENETVLIAEIPGVAKEDVKLSVQDDLLTITGIRKAPKVPENSARLRNEILTGELSRTVQLPHVVKLDAISAELKDGILRVVLPKSDEVRPREIKVR